MFVYLKPAQSLLWWTKAYDTLSGFFLLPVSTIRQLLPAACQCVMNFCCWFLLVPVAAKDQPVLWLLLHDQFGIFSHLYNISWTAKARDLYFVQWLAMWCHSIGMTYCLPKRVRSLSRGVFKFWKFSQHTSKNSTEQTVILQYKIIWNCIQPAKWHK